MSWTQERSGSSCRAFGALTLLIVGISFLLVRPARAEDDAVSALLFGSLDAGPSVFATGGAKIAFDRIDREGFAILASAGMGHRSERGPTAQAGGPTRAVRWTTLGAALFGYQWFHDWGVLAVYAGPEGSAEALSCGCGTRTLPVRLGVRLHGEVWARPSEATLLNATLILGSARGDLWTRLAYGDRIHGVYVGPELAVYGDGTGYRKWSFGLHATDLVVAGLRLRIAAGYLLETQTQRGSPYVAVSAWMPL